MNLRTIRRAIAVPAVAAVILAGCSSGGAITATDAWVRMTDPSATAAGYLVISNTTSTADSLVSVSTPAYAHVELHETVMMPSASPMASMDAMASPGGANGGMMGMQPVSEIPVPANGTVELKPGGYHIMLMQPTGTLKIGDTVTLTLTFRDAGRVAVTAEVKGA